MKKLILVLFGLCFMLKLNAQDKKPAFITAPPKIQLPDIKNYIRTVQGDVGLYTKNFGNHSQEHDVNSIVLDIEKYIDSMQGKKSQADQLLMKEFNPLRHFFLTTTNKTTVATSFLYSGNPYQFCSYNDTAVALYIHAVKDGDNYNLAKVTDKKIIKNALEKCLLPSLRALDEFTDNEIKYIGISIYYGCKDSREGAAPGVVVPYCLTLVARVSDLQQFATGLITGKGLLASADIYISDEEDAADLKKIQINLD